MSRFLLLRLRHGDKHIDGLGGRGEVREGIRVAGPGPVEDRYVRDWLPLQSSISQPVPDECGLRRDEHGAGVLLHVFGAVHRGIPGGD